MKILILGHRGMLGRTLLNFFNSTSHTTSFITSRWGDADFGDAIVNSKPDLIINCIGKIPQKTPDRQEYIKINLELPNFLESLKLPILHPTTDCEFSGDIAPGEFYKRDSVRDATDDYGSSKAQIAKKIEDDFTYTKMIRTSIIGHEETTNFSLLDWFLSQDKEVNGYTNQFWNGITTLEWAKQALKITEDWENSPTLTQLGLTTPLSKFALLGKIKEIYGKKITITPTQTAVTLNKSLLSDVCLPSIEKQLHELKEFFKK